jgi:hypothetical protein
MHNTARIAKSSLLLALIGFVLGCVVTPVEGYYDRDHHRYYHERSWHECHEHDEFCR